MKFSLLIITTLFVSITSVDRQKLAKFPKPVKNFDLEWWSSGVWYTQARYVPCSFAGSKQFSDIKVIGQLDGNLLRQTYIWRNGLCSKVLMLLEVLENGNGNFIQRDPFGDMYTGNQVVVDCSIEKGFEISWGCTKKSIDGDCDDTFLVVKTRERFPGDFVWECIEQNLKRLFDISLLEMQIVSHDNPC